MYVIRTSMIQKSCKSKIIFVFFPNQLYFKLGVPLAIEITIFCLILIGTDSRGFDLEAISFTWLDCNEWSKFLASVFTKKVCSWN